MRVRMCAEEWREVVYVFEPPQSSYRYDATRPNDDSPKEGRERIQVVNEGGERGGVRYESVVRTVRCRRE